MAIASIPLIMTLGNSMLVPVFPQMKSSLHLSQFQVSLTITVFSIAAAIFIPIAGYLSDRFSRKAVILPCLILYGAGGLLGGAAAAWFGNPFLWIIVGRILQGLGASGTAPIAMALTGDLFNGSKESKVLGLVEASNGFGKVLSPILGSLLAILAWYMVFFAFPAVCVLSILLTWIFVKEKKKQKSAPPFGQYLKGLGSVFKQEGRWLLTAYLAGAVCLMTIFGILFYLSDVLEQKYNLEGVPKGGILAIPLGVMLLTNYLTGSLIKQNQKRMKMFIVIGLLLMTASFSTLVFFQALIPFLAILAVSSVGTGMVLPCLNTLITSAVGQSKRGFVTSLYGSVRFLGVAAGPPLYGFLMEWSRTGMFLSTAGLTLVTAFLSLLLIKVPSKEPEKQKQSLFQKLEFNTQK
nr:MFS transporter [Tuberibacillus sp. Marseille-P3662]